MRIWTLHPRYLDPQGLVALWREALLARAVLRGGTKGYRHHPQLLRFQAHAAPRSAIGPIESTSGQLRYEWQHLMKKLKARNPALYAKWRKLASPEPHPSFSIRRGAIEKWERR